MKLIGVAIKVDVSKINQTFFDNFEESSENEIENNSISGRNDSTATGRLSDSDIKKLEDTLKKELSPTKTAQIVHFLKGFREGSTSKETENSIVNDHIFF